MSLVRWIVIIIFLVVTVISSFDLGPNINAIMPVLSVISLFCAACLHGKIRYGLKNLAIFFIITWLVSHFFEALSIQIGFPFGHYHYEKLAGPRLFEVPLIIMFAYFSMAYVSWILSTVILNQYFKPLQADKVFLIPFVATFIMVMWDLCMDPLSSSIGSLWVWKGGGSYFGVPLQNYFGWFFVVYIIFQSFALYIAKHELYSDEQHKVFIRKSFWFEAVALYGIQGLFQLLSPFTTVDHKDIYGPMALVTIFTMMFVTLISFVLIKDSRKLEHTY
ncbi:MAG: carotenoid biosynthesis protein [Parachlamydiales bacterium]|jgi:putative membrane protein